VFLLLQLTGITHDMAKDTPFWELFEAPFDIEDGVDAWEACREAVRTNGEFFVRGVRVKDAKLANDQLFCLRFRFGGWEPLALAVRRSVWFGKARGQAPAFPEQGHTWSYAQEHIWTLFGDT
jgi:hypothetical protein